jgi:hypothetical protein
MIDDPIEKLRAMFKFKRNPEDLGDGGLAFIGFLNFVSGDSDEAHSVQLAYFKDTGGHPLDDMRASPEQAGKYIDWLIETQWGEDKAKEGRIAGQEKKE